MGIFWDKGKSGDRYYTVAKNIVQSVPSVQIDDKNVDAIMDDKNGVLNTVQAIVHKNTDDKDAKGGMDGILLYLRDKSNCKDTLENIAKGLGKSQDDTLALLKKGDGVDWSSPRHNVWKARCTGRMGKRSPKKNNN